MTTALLPHMGVIVVSLYLLFIVQQFLASTAGLHIAEAVAGLLMLEDRRGQLALRVTGGATAMVGVILLR